MTDISYVSILGASGQPIHIWQRNNTWLEACQWLSQFEQMQLAISSNTNVFLPGHIFESDSADHIVDSSGKPVYNSDCKVNHNISIQVTVDPRFLLPIYEPKTLIAVINTPNTKEHKWIRVNDWSDACEWLEVQNPDNKVLKAHIIPESLAISIRLPDGLPVYPKSLPEKLRTVIFN